MKKTTSEIGKPSEIDYDEELRNVALELGEICNIILMHRWNNCKPSLERHSLLNEQQESVIRHYRDILCERINEISYLITINKKESEPMACGTKVKGGKKKPTKKK